MPEPIIPASYNEHFIKSLKWDGKVRRLLIGDCLILQVRRSSKTWLVRRRVSKARNCYDRSEVRYP